MKKSVKFMFIILFLVFCTGCSFTNISSSISSTISDNSNNLVIHYIDVGQGDSIFIEFPNDENMLIDAGESQYGNIVKDYISDLGYKDIDYLIGTHPHSDHIGGMKTIVNNFDIKKIYMPNAVTTTATYKNLLMAIDNKGLSITTATAGKSILKTEDLSVSIVAPNSDSYKDLNNYSAVIKIIYKDRSFLFMGDAEALSENEITDDIDVDVVKVGHHGSDSSSSIDFVNKVSAKYAIISVGKDNKYNHPYQDILDRWKNSGSTIYRTDEDGTIILTSDGIGINIKTKNNELNDDSINNNSENSEITGIELVDITNPIIKGNDATISIKGESNVNYSIKVMNKSGQSTAKGLEDKISDNDGNVSWTWKVASNTSSGTYKIIISDGKTEESFDYTIN